jgi:hypothetical protein
MGVFEGLAEANRLLRKAFLSGACVGANMPACFVLPFAVLLIESLQPVLFHLKDNLLELPQ